jgi:ferrochelatase
MAANVRAALEKFPADERANVPVLFTAHSIPMSMADTSKYVVQLQEACRLVAEQAGVADWKLVYQSRSGPPTQPWLEPDICDEVRQQHASGRDKLVIAPIGFISDHMEVLYDLDTEAVDLCRELGVEMARAATVGTAPEFVAAVRELIAERAWELPDRIAIGCMPANHDVCPLDCCPAPQRPAGAGRPGGPPAAGGGGRPA